MSGGGTVRLTMSQALLRYLMAQHIEVDGEERPYFAGVWAIFGHGNVAGMGEALHAVKDRLPTWRAHNEQGMAHAAIAYAKARFRTGAMVCSTSIGPGATNLVTAAALAHVNRLPVLLLPSDVFANRRPDPVLQQIEDFGDGTTSVTDCFRPVSRYFDRITRPEQIISALPRTMATFTDPAGCGPVTLALCQDVQAESYDYPLAFFEKRVWRIRRPEPDAAEFAGLADAIRGARRPLIVSGGGVLYARAAEALRALVAETGIPVVETHGGKGALSWRDPLNAGSIGVTGSTAANALAAEADVVIGLGTRLQDFTTGSRTVFAAPDRRLVQVNVQPFDAHKHGAVPVVGDAGIVIDRLADALAGHRAPGDWTTRARDLADDWRAKVQAVMNATPTAPFQYADVVGAVDRAADADSIAVCAAGTLPAELHKLWRSERPGGYHMEYGYSCMGYEVAGGFGAKMADPSREVFVMVGDGSYLMLNSELATSVMMGYRIIVVLFDSEGYSCINRLQRSAGGADFNNMFRDSVQVVAPQFDYVAHARSLGALAEKADDMAALEDALARARRADRSTVIVVDVDPYEETNLGGHWWDVVVPEVSDREAVRAARAAYEQQVAKQRIDG
ncbi:MAG: 3D-(3,5/4)-trihydroxycyclohexane-1,2-dione acylhydrolase (decyclizing) [Sphingomonas adhaesiva]|uniref:3D-(3,5/4)-trihydroxycyclohexane-1,2-dione acylhydrolase (decyclizing) n=1 Tax=Sphingomonas adhaesiva TaxID=28212 RepID=UPI002FFAF90A